MKVRFNEVDSLGIAWHGHYVKYFEDGREAFGQEHGLGYLDVYRNGLVIPIVSLSCNYRKPLQYGDSILIETTYVDSPAAKIQFDYKVYEQREHTLVAEGTTTQVFLDAETRTLLLNSPEFFENWKKRVLPANSPS
ncbi:acyl-CoA thioesterase [Hymenobacter saemangeumensis]|uniref:acyl-CoA thioesterase n=1 Tax=Hymenobacter saemangeumensis TaxID=1084522 RepID=UPI0031F17EC9